MKDYFRKFALYISIEMDENAIRSEFPILSRTVYGKPLVYLDNAATTQRPRCVVDLFSKLSLESNANIHRSVHRLSSEATSSYESARDRVCRFINAQSREEVVFTSGTTGSINLVASSFCERFLEEGDEVLVSEAEHHSDIVPWQLGSGRKKAAVKPLRIADSGEVDLDVLEKSISEKTKIVAINLISNILGIKNPVKEIIAVCHGKGVPVLVDAAQAALHEKIDVKDLDCDFLAFSGHKVFAVPGVGVLYGKRKWLDEMPPFLGGGEMIKSVSFSGTSFAPLPGKFEAGTQNITGVPTLVPALDLADQLQCDKETEARMAAIRDFVMDRLLGDDRVVLYGVPRRTEDKIPLFSFSVKGAHHEDLALILDKMGIAVRSGQMCAEPLMDRFGVTGMVRCSFAPYNTLSEAEYFIESLDRAIKMLL